MVTIAVKLFLIFGLLLAVSGQRDRPIRCPRGKVFQACGSACANLCPDAGLMCPFVCIPGCFCPPGKIDVGGICKDIDEYCTKPQCPPGQTYNECGNACDDLCPDAGVICTLQCTPGCYCPAGQMVVDGECVDKEEYCKISVYCGPNATWRNGTDNEDSCFGQSATELVLEGCFCDVGYSRVKDECVPWQQCLTDQECPEGQSFDLCGNECFDLCPDTNRVCNKMCQPGCYCPSGFVKVDGACALIEETCGDYITTEAQTEIY